MKHLVFFLTLVAIIIVNGLQAQQLTGTIKGQITDQVTKMPLPGATVILADSDPLIGVSTDANGMFRMENVPVGRLKLRIQFIGYEANEATNLNLTSGKELIVNVSLTEQITTMKEVVIKAEESKEEPINAMATVSARSFSIEESQRYAGSRNDVARMATNFAGVRGGNDSQNDIVIRGNSPSGLLWRLEGIDIPNPNHFGNLGATGGPVSMLNNNVLSNSDFITAAFPAEYGNALSGVFDLKMRNGNSDKHEFLGQVGFNGFEFGAEGPMLRKKGGSYLINYRYSTLEVMKKMGVNFGTGTAIPDYQDISFKLNLPVKKGSISLFGIGGISAISLLGSEKDTTSGDDYYGDDNLDIINTNYIGVLGASYKRVLNASSYLNISIAASQLKNRALVDTVNKITRESCNCNWVDNNTISGKLFTTIYYVKKFNARNNLKVGIMASHITFDLTNKRNAGDGTFDYRYNENGTTQLIQPYAQWQYRAGEKLTFSPGLHADYLALTNEFALQPRAAIRYKINNRTNFNLGYGLHAQMQNPLVYYGLIADSISGELLLANDDIKMTKSHHFVAGFDKMLTSKMRIKVEAYYQYLFQVPISTVNSTWSTINYGGDLTQYNFSDAQQYLTNEGKGKNWGLEFTLEHFMSAGFYFLTTASIYESTYLAGDGKWRNTAFANRFVTNGLVGKEWVLQSGKGESTRRTVIFADAKVMWAGGQRYTSIDLAQSQLNQEKVYALETAYNNQFNDYFRLDLNVGFRMSGKRFTQEWNIMTQNITGNENALFQNYNPATNSATQVNQLGLFIVPQYKITF